MPEHRQPLDQSVIVMGVSGCGKSTVGRLLAGRTGAEFFDGDDFHPPENVAKMASGKPLTDDDRQGWLLALRNLLDAHEKPVIIACSALKKSYRDLLRTSSRPIRLAYLHGERNTLLERMQLRREKENHFMPASLLDSQLDTLEAPTPAENALTISITHHPGQIVEIILSTDH